MYTKVDQEKKQTKKLNTKIKENLDYLKVTYDLSFVKYELYASIIGIVLIGLVLALGYKLPFVDPIGRTKGIVLSIQIVIAVLSILAIGLIAIKTKLRDSILRNFLIFSTIVLVLVLGEGISISKVAKSYTEEDFGRYYEQYELNGEEDDSTRTKLSLSTSGITSSTAKADYIKTSKSAFTNFVIRAVILMILELSILGFSFYILYKVMRTNARLAATSSNSAA